MNNNLDRIFQEQLKNLEATPSKKVWNSIESKLVKKKRRILPLWWFSGGIAALLVLGIFLYPFTKDDNVLNKTKKKDVFITNSKKEKTEVTNDVIINKDSLKEKSKNNETILIAKEKKTESKNLVKKPKKNNVANYIKNIDEKNTIKKISKKDSSKAKVTFQKEQILKDTFQKNKTKNLILKPKKDFIAQVDSVKKKDKKNKRTNRWSVAPSFAVLKANSFTDTSPLNVNLASSTKGENSFSYGVKVTYQINDKWALQTGIHLQETNYSNNKIAVTPSSKAEISSIRFNDGNTVDLLSLDSANLNASSLLNFDGNLSQKYGYIEVPIEVKYNLLESKKFTTHIVAGFSSLFLNKNNISLNTGSISGTGKATNLNNLNFSGNLGFDFHYFINKNWSLYVNPMFKSQLNTFSSNSNGFSPFNIGVYTGVNYQF